MTGEGPDISDSGYQLWASSDYVDDQEGGWALEPAVGESDACVDGWLGGSFDDDGFSHLSAEAFVGVPSAAATCSDGWTADFEAVPSVSKPLSDEEVRLIRGAMATLDIQPPPWVRKMQHMQRIQQTLQQAEPSLPPEVAAAAAGMTNPEVAWVEHVQQRGCHALPVATLAHASPLGIQPAGLPGMGRPHRKLTGRQVVANRRKEREDAARGSAAASRAVLGT